MKWQQILKDYDLRHCRNEEHEVAWFREQTSLRAAIEVGAQATDRRGKRYSHQWRIRRESIKQATMVLLVAEDRFVRAKSFDELLALITDQLRDVLGVGELYCYDAAFRIGAYLGRFPTRVHLHAGTRIGARTLGLAYRKDALDMSEVPAALRHRKPHEVEDILCIYADVFRGGALLEADCRPCGRQRKQRCSS